MTLAAAVAGLSVVVAAYVAALANRFSRAPGWAHQRQFAWAALAVAGYSACDLPTALGLSEPLVVWGSRFQVACGALHSLFWLRYSSALLERRETRVDRVAVPALLAIAAISAATPLFFPGGMFVHEFRPLGLRYHNAVMSPFGEAAAGIILVMLFVPAVRFAVAWRRGVPYAAVFFFSLLFLVAMGTSDTLAAAGHYPAPYLVDVGFVVPVGAVAFSLTSRFVEDARALEALRARLVGEVAERTTELGRTQEQLQRAERLAAVGQFAAAVAHEVNNPTAVVSANLHYLLDAEADALSDDGREALRESLLSVQRTTAIVRQLLDAGRVAASAEPPRSVELRGLGDAAARAAYARFGRRAKVANRIPPGLTASAQEGLLLQVVANLVVNGIQAVPEGRAGQVVLTAEPRGDRVRIVVEDDGTGMAPDVLERVFEPFFTTKPAGSGTGLGLAVSRGLVLGIGGDLRLESEKGVGTRAIVELPLGGPPETAPRDDDRDEAAPAPRLRLLVVDDEGSVRSSLRRLLHGRYDVELADGVDEGLRWLGCEEFDVVLCNVTMPAGGGARLYETLATRSPGQARRVVFLTGGAVTDDAKRFLEAQPQPVLYKPLDALALARAVEAL